jgi:hypothetical protein
MQGGNNAEDQEDHPALRRNSTQPRWSSTIPQDDTCDMLDDDDDDGDAFGQLQSYAREVSESPSDGLVMPPPALAPDITTDSEFEDMDTSVSKSGYCLADLTPSSQQIYQTDVGRPPDSVSALEESPERPGGTDMLDEGPAGEQACFAEALVKAAVSEHMGMHGAALMPGLADLTTLSSAKWNVEGIAADVTNPPTTQLLADVDDQPLQAVGESRWPGEAPAHPVLLMHAVTMS